MTGISSSHTFWDYILLGAGVVAAVWFFACYSSQDPHSAIHLSISRETARLKAAEVLSELGYSAGEYTAEVSFQSNNDLLDSLQHDLGRDTAIRILEADTTANIKPYYWEVRFYNTSSGEDDQDVEVSSGESRNVFDDASLVVRLDTGGNVFELLNVEDRLPARKIHAEVLQAAFEQSADGAGSGILPAISDSLLNQLLSFNFQQSTTDSLVRPEDRSWLIAEHITKNIPYRLSMQEAELLAEYYIKNMGWDLTGLRPDTTMIERVQSVNTAQVQFISKAPVMEQNVTVSARVAPTGSLISIQSQYNASDSSFSSWENIWGMIKGGLIFLFGLWCIIIFFFRIRARAIDTHSALVIAILAGLIVPGSVLLESLPEVRLFSSSTEWMELVGLIIGMGVLGAFSSIAFFVLFAISDSITRQHWPGKLGSYDYLRQGMIYNKPVGVVVLRSLILAFILAGIWTAALWILPGLYIQFDPVFYQGAVTWPPLYLLLETLWFSFCIIIIIFLIVGSQTYAQTKNHWFAGLAATLACGLIVPELSSFGPPLEEFLVGIVLGASLTFIYLRWDFLTVLLSHFLFLGLIGSSSGWVVAGSPDTYVFVSFLFFLLFLLVGGSLALLRGKEEQVLPRYVPEYVEELAQEERIRQELQIAREVQQSFLPVRTPDIKGLDIAALCRPAYETGGDYYDFIQLDEHRIALTIGDVSGKGIQAAFYMTFTKGILHSLCRETESPAELLIKANRLFCDNTRKGTFISLVYGIIDLKQKTFTFARAGHNPILRINSASGHVEELQPVGLGLGLTKEILFDNNIREIQLTVHEDDVLVLYTDGIVEALNENRQFYGSERLISLLAKKRKNSSPEILSELFKDVITFIGKAQQHDDMTIMVIRLDNDQ